MKPLRLNALKIIPKRTEEPVDGRSSATSPWPVVAIILAAAFILGLLYGKFNPRERIVFDNGHLTYQQQLDTLDPNALVIKEGIKQ